MKYFKNTELAKLYHISEKSVRNWTEAAQLGRLRLQLHEHNGKHFIANTPQNTVVIENLVQRGKKYKNARGVKKLEPKPEFYEYFDSKQILDIISNLTVHNETPLQYTYVDGGANDWDRYATHLASETAPNVLNNTIIALDMLDKDIHDLLKQYDRINVVDLGPGNGMPIRPMLEKLLAQNRLNRYIAIDISKDMLDLLGKNIQDWFGGTIKTELHLRDLTYERFNDVLASDITDPKTVNLIFFLGGTLDNFRNPEQVLNVISNSMGVNDILITSGYLDTAKNRLYFDNYNPERKVPIQDGLILDFLGIDQTMYEVEQVYNEQKHCRSTSVRLKFDISIEFKFKNGTHTVELRKNEPILIWRHWHKTIVELVNQLDYNGFEVILAAKAHDENYSLTISKIKTGIDN
jgi:uncharacterized SAM-dependent methyltransferase